MNEEYAIKITNLCKSYKDFSLDNVSLTVRMGTIMGFIGENGAGKSTTIKAVLNLIKPDRGSIEVLGVPAVSEDYQKKASIGVVFDENSSTDTLMIKNLEKIMPKIYKNYWDDTKFSKLVRDFELPRNKIIKDFSRGMKMKLSLVIALSHNAKLLILDEATSGLDPVSRDDILEIIRDYIQDEKNTVFISSHITSDLEKIADYITFIHKGRIELSESKDELLYRYGILKCSNDFYAELDRKNLISVRKNTFGCEILVKDRSAIKLKYPDAVVDPVSLEEIMLFKIKGEAV